MATEDDLQHAVTKAREFLSLLRGHGIPFGRAYLFGSFARGTAHEDSDIDVAVVAESWAPDIVDARFELLKLASRVDTRIEPHPMAEESFRSNDPFAREIVRTGVALIDGPR